MSNEDGVPEGALKGSMLVHERGGGSRAVFFKAENPANLEPDISYYNQVYVQIDEYMVVYLLTQHHPKPHDSDDANLLTCNTKKAWGTALRDWFIYMMTREVYASKILRGIIRDVIKEVKDEEAATKRDRKPAAQRMH